MGSGSIYIKPQFAQYLNANLFLDFYIYFQLEIEESHFCRHSSTRIYFWSETRYGHTINFYLFSFGQYQNYTGINGVTIRDKGFRFCVIWDLPINYNAFIIIELISW